MKFDWPQVRQGLAADVQTLAEIERQAAIVPWSLSQLLTSSLREKDHCLVVEEGPELISGFCIYQRILDEASLLNIAIRPDRQGQGLAGVLLAQLLRVLLESGVQRCLLEVRQSNAAATALYYKYGFVDDAIRKDYYPTKVGREDAILMSCQLVAEQ
jgi:ribosomal-protein-alanine N-acetyltransferase